MKLFRLIFVMIGLGVFLPVALLVGTPGGYWGAFGPYIGISFFVWAGIHDWNEGIEYAALRDEMRRLGYCDSEWYKFYMWGNCTTVSSLVDAIYEKRSEELSEDYVTGTHSRQSFEREIAKAIERQTA